MAAVEAGADGYVQKPISVDVVEGQAILAAARDQDLTVEWVLETHAHADHVLASIAQGDITITHVLKALFPDVDEHTEPQHTVGSFWYMWKLPMFGETDVNRVLAEAEACHKANPNNHVRLVGYDNFAQSQGTAMVIYRGKTV